ncbi:eRF1 domain-containing protein 2 [Halogranum gelatinilyticum]|uniref:ERF1 domain-containing protein 2 n=1 Tax=Halogranum gelatinilyticum TaxID=660521 RepID=A0A1G9UA43_9EURY|nr:Vms1/Ankzf1 family peptidyl-tRNA hydrolase [Halogranum gelatinilyticum]SDM56594.1 eRF1 domain-containing protein 2 [Halogranum gelatinilyticum]
MLDELLGRAELKARIEELEEEKHHLQRRVDAEEERRADAASARQDAEERVNRLEDRIEALQDKVSRLEGDEAEVEFRGVETLGGARLDDVLARLDSVETAPEGALTAMVDDDVPDAVRDALGDHAPLVGRAAPCLVYTDDAGLVSAALTPPLAPDAFCEWADGFRVDESWFRPTGTFGFALVRSDLFALGVYDGSELQSAETFETDVMNKHSKGGFSQARFERRRDQQVDDHLDKAEEIIADHDVDSLVVVGERTVLSRFRDRADRTAAVDASGDPDEALEDAFREFWTTRLYRL